MKWSLALVCLLCEDYCGEAGVVDVDDGSLMNVPGS